MTINEAISKIDDYKSNVFSVPDKISWLSRLDGMVKRLVIDNYEGGSDIEFTGYNEDTDLHTELLVPFPFDSIYLYWLEAQIDYYNNELPKYNNSITMFQTSFETYKSDYNANHMPKSHGKRFIF